MITTINEYNEFIIEQARANLFHGLKFEYALNALNSNKLDAYTTQRYWPNGKRLKDDDPNYDKSHWYRGLSLTRDIKYALNWSDVVFVFKQDELKYKYKIIPYNWGYSIGRGYEQKERVKREKEEFLITSYVDKPVSSEEFMKMIKTNGGSVAPLDKYLKGFYISKRVYDIYTSNDTIKNSNIEELINKHNKYYLGIL